MPATFNLKDNLPDMVTTMAAVLAAVPVLVVGAAMWTMRKLDIT